MIFEEICGLVVLLSVLPLTTIIGLIIYWRESVGNTPKIKFSAFKKFYAINPDRWDFYDDSVLCIPSDVPGVIHFHFGFIDFYRYKLWYRSLEKRDREQYNLEAIAEMIKSVKKDIEKTEKMASQKYKEAADIMRGVYQKEF